MLLRKKPIRGEEVKTLDGATYSFLETQPNGWAKVINDFGKIICIPANKLVLPIVDTKFYEKIKKDDLSQVQKPAHGG